MVRKKITWLILMTLTLIGFESNIQKATAQTSNNIYKFSNDYKTSVQINDLASQPGFVRATITGTSDAKAPFGLNSFISNTYGRLEPSNNPSIIRYIFNSDPKVFGLPGNLEIFSDRYFGGSDELFGRASDKAEINLEAGTISGSGTITIFDGTGIFDNATGTITFTQEDRLNPQGTSVGLAKLNFHVRTPRQIPEPTAARTLVGIGLTGACLLLCRHRRKIILHN